VVVGGVVAEVATLSAWLLCLPGLPGLAAALPVPVPVLFLGAVCCCVTAVLRRPAPVSGVVVASALMLCSGRSAFPRVCRRSSRLAARAVKLWLWSLC
jgi:hypothetical protein